jgi:cellobiose transport system substrate-binding protein
VPRFAERHPGIRPQFVPTPLTETATKLVAVTAAGRGAPDLAYVAYNQMPLFTARDGAGVVDLRGPMRTDGRRPDEWVAYALELVTARSGKLLGLPTDLGVAATFYRRDVLDQAGLPSAPERVADLLKTWDAYAAAGLRVTATGAAMLGDAGEVFDLLRQQGRQGYFDDAGRPAVDRPGFVAAAEQALKLRRAGLDLASAALQVDPPVAMQQGKLATYFSAAWFDIFIDLWAPQTHGRWGVVPLPGGASASLGASYWVLPTERRHERQAGAFCAFVSASREGLLPALQKAKFLPAWRPIFGEPAFTAPDPRFGDQAWLKQFVDGLERVPVLKPTIHDGIAEEELGKALRAILADGAPIQGTLTGANRAIAARLPA